MSLPPEIWFYARQGVKAGPVSIAQLRLHLEEGYLDRETDLVWAEGLEDWKPPSRVPALLEEAPPWAGPDSEDGAPGLLPAVEEARFGLLLLCFGAGFTLAIGGLVAIYWGELRGLSMARDPFSKLLTVLGTTAAFASAGFLIAGIVLVSTYLYRAWLILQPFGAPLTPGLAVGLLFVPIFNLYWSFRAILGWAQTYNRVIRDDPAFESAPRANTVAFLALCSLLIVRLLARVFAAIFVDSRILLSIAGLLGLAVLVLAMICAYQVCAAVNHFGRLHDRADRR